jgi:hypothetical protein
MHNGGTQQPQAVSGQVARGGSSQRRCTQPSCSRNRRQLTAAGQVWLACIKAARRVTATSAARGRHAAGALKQPVTQALDGRLDNLDLRHRPRLKVRVNTRSR